MKLENTVQALQKFGKTVVKDGRKILKKNDMGNDTKLYKDFDYIVQANATSVDLIFEFGEATKYWDFVNEGVKGSGGFKGSGKMRGQGSPYKFKGKNIKEGVVKDWIISKGIKLRGKGGRFIEKSTSNINSAAYVIGRAIAQRGLKRTLFFTNPFEQELNNQEDNILNALGDDVMLYLGEVYAT